jgi:hypothetical protein
MGLSKGRSFSYLEGREVEGNPNEGLPASEAVAAPAHVSAGYQLSAGLYDELDDAKVSQDYLHAVHPETGLEVVFVPGEALPAWAREEQRAALQPSPAPAKKPAKGKGQRSVKAQIGENEA